MRGSHLHSKHLRDLRQILILVAWTFFTVRLPYSGCLRSDAVPERLIP